MTTKNIQDVVAERVEEYKREFDLRAIPDQPRCTINAVIPQKVTDWLTTTLTTLLTEREAEVRREERERTKLWCTEELSPIQSQLKDEPNHEVREYLIGQRNKLHDLQIFLTQSELDQPDLLDDTKGA